MLQAFMIVGRAMVFHVARAFNLPTRGKATRKGKGKATGGPRRPPKPRGPEPP